MNASSKSATLSSSKLQEKDLTHRLQGKIPASIAIIPDGNRRWAKMHGLSVRKGHEAGAKKMIQIVRTAQQIGIKEITFYIFSTENWSRHETEIHTLFYLFDSYLDKKRKEMIAEGVRFFTIGNLSPLPPALLSNIEQTKQMTACGNTIDVILAVNYGGRDEIIRATRALLDDFAKHTVKQKEITETLFSQYLDTARFRDPELLIRTSGEKRQSNFLIWQSSYAEWAFTEKLWPDFQPEDLLQILVDYQQRERRIGS